MLNDYEISKLNNDIKVQDNGEIELQDIENAFMLYNKVESGEKACKLIKYLEYSNDNIDSEIKRLQDLKFDNNKKIEKVKTYVNNVVNTTGYKNFNLFRVETRRSEAIEVDKVDIDKIDEQFLNIKEVKTISKEKIKEYLKSPAMINQETGEVIPNQLNWARIVENINISIK